MELRQQYIVKTVGY